jgi:hypothetical protein
MLWREGLGVTYYIAFFKVPITDSNALANPPLPRLQSVSIFYGLLKSLT